MKLSRKCQDDTKKLVFQARLNRRLKASAEGFNQLLVRPLRVLSIAVNTQDAGVDQQVVHLCCFVPSNVDSRHPACLQAQGARLDRLARLKRQLWQDGDSCGHEIGL